MPGLDGRTAALVRLAALIALEAGESSYQREFGSAAACGASVDDAVGVLIAVAPVVGSARVFSAAPKLAAAAGYDVDAALEAHETDEAD